MSRRAPAECRARAGGGDASGRRERTAPVELRSLDLLNGVRRQPLGYNRPTVQALPYSTIPRVYEVENVTGFWPLRAKPRRETSQQAESEH